MFPGAHPIADLHYHGTHVAATVSSNAYITAGVTSQTTLMGVKVCSPFLGGCPDSAIFQGLLHAADNGADVINMSLGGYFSKAKGRGLVGFENRLGNYIRSKGVTVVVSAGNSAIDMDHDGNSYKTFCSTPNTICVSATDDGDTPASYTNYGKSAINVAAPGGDNAAVWAPCSRTSLVIPVCRTGYFIVGLTGTSMASPHVAGLAALVVEDVGRNPGKVRAKIQKGADDLGKKGTDAYYGKGRINVAKTLGL